MKANKWFCERVCSALCVYFRSICSTYYSMLAFGIFVECVFSLATAAAHNIDITIQHLYSPEWIECVCVCVWERLKRNDRDSSPCHWRQNLFYNYIQLNIGLIIILLKSAVAVAVAVSKLFFNNWQPTSRLQSKHGALNHFTIRIKLYIQCSAYTQRQTETHIILHTIENGRDRAI